MKLKQNSGYISVKTKRPIMIAILITLFIGLTQITIAQNVGIGTTTPDNSAILDVISTSKGILVPRMTATERGNISSPATGLLVYQTDNPAGFYYYDGSTGVQVSTGTSTVSEINDLSDGKSDAAGSSLFLGKDAGLNEDGIDRRNLGLGFNALKLNTTGNQNVAT